MAPLKPEQLRKEIAGYLSLYLKKGGIVNPRIAENIFEGISVEDSDKLIKIHFLLYPPEEDRTNVINFVGNLIQWIRRIKTVNKTELIETGEVRGRIDWNQTIKRRYGCNAGDRSVFVCSSPAKQYDIDENLVLKKLLCVIYDIISFKEWEDAVEKEYDWVGGWLKEADGGIDLITELREIFEKNVHIKRIRDANEYEVTDKMINKALCSRSELYREAGRLLLLYNELMDETLSHVDITKVLNQIEPKEDVLFELYCVFKLIDMFEEGNLQFRPMYRGETHVATYKKNDVEFRIFHNSTGSKKLSFDMKRVEVEKSKTEGVMTRWKRVLLETNDTFCHLKGKEVEDSSVYSGRPDIIVEKTKNGELEELLIGEVKFTENEGTARQGLRELLEYVYSARWDRTHLKDLLDNRAGIVKGFLVVNGWPSSFKNKAPPYTDTFKTVTMLTSDNMRDGKFNLIMD